MRIPGTVFSDLPLPGSVKSTPEEAEALYELIDTLSGGNARNVFSWDGNDNPTDPTISACVKLFKVAGRRIPEDLQ